MKNVFNAKCPHCGKILKIYVVDKTDEVNGIRIDEVVFEEAPKE